MNGDKKLFIDKGQFDCGDHIAFVMEEDFRAMKQAVKYLQEFIEYKPPVTFGDHSVVNAIEILNERINDFKPNCPIGAKEGEGKNK